MARPQTRLRRQRSVGGNAPIKIPSLVKSNIEIASTVASGLRNIAGAYAENNAAQARLKAQKQKVSRAAPDYFNKVIPDLKVKFGSLTAKQRAEAGGFGAYTARQLRSEEFRNNFRKKFPGLEIPDDQFDKIESYQARIGDPFDEKGATVKEISRIIEENPSVQVRVNPGDGKPYTQVTDVRSKIIDAIGEKKFYDIFEGREGADAFLKKADIETGKKYIEDSILAGARKRDFDNYIAEMTRKHNLKSGEVAELKAARNVGYARRMAQLGANVETTWKLNFARAKLNPYATAYGGRANFVADQVAGNALNAAQAAFTGGDSGGAESTLQDILNSGSVDPQVKNALRPALQNLNKALNLSIAGPPKKTNIIPRGVTPSDNLFAANYTRLLHDMVSRDSEKFPGFATMSPLKKFEITAPLQRNAGVASSVFNTASSNNLAKNLSRYRNAGMTAEEVARLVYGGERGALGKRLAEIKATQAPTPPETAKKPGMMEKLRGMIDKIRGRAADAAEFRKGGDIKGVPSGQGGFNPRRSK